MAQEAYWTDDIIWNDNSFLWSGVIEIVAERHFFSSTRHTGRKKQEKYHPREVEKYETEYIRLVCVVDDETFDKTNYINKKLNVELMQGDFIIREVKQMPDVKAENVNWKATKQSDDKIKVTISNVQII